ncbi:MAG: hypothetical protein ACI8X5_002799 [Planctomycetota bacterium]|jgi:hypothetical protein
MIRSTLLILAALASQSLSRQQMLTQPPASVVTELPFPLKTTTLKTAGVSYFVSGRVRLPHNQTVVSLREMNLVGRGERAVLEVSGKLEIKAVTGGRVNITNLTIEVMPDCKDLLISDANISGGGGIISSETGPSSAEIYLHGLRVSGSAKIDLKMSGGQIDLQSSSVATPVHLKGINASEKNRAKLKVILLGNRPSIGGLSGGLFIDNAYDALVRNCLIGGKHSLMSNCQKLDFDGNGVRSTKFEITQKGPKDFKKTKIKSCDFSSPTIRIYAPLDPKSPDKLERFSIQSCWFNGATTPDVIREKYVMDNGREKGNGMLVTLKRVSAGRKGLGG